MIESVKIENYQSHKTTALEFVPGVNVIIGKSDSGKSAIFNALNWAITNRPLGDSFRSEWGGGTIVKIKLSDAEIIRTRTNGENSYTLNGELLEAFGVNVPEEIETAFKIAPQNIQNQMDSPFLLSMSPGEAAKELNRVAGIDEIDILISSLRKSVSKFSTDLQYKQGELERIERELLLYENLNSLENEVIKSEELDKKLQTLNYGKQEINSIASKIEGLKTQLDPLDFTFSHIYPLFQQTNRKFNNYGNRKRKTEEVAGTVKKLGQINEALEKSKNITLVEKEIKKAETANTKRQNTDVKKNSLKGVLKSLEDLLTTRYTLEKEIKQNEKIYKEKMPEVCPLCDSPIKKEAK